MKTTTTPKKKAAKPTKPSNETRLATIEQSLEAVAIYIYNRMEDEESPEDRSSVAIGLSVAAIIISVGFAVAQAFRLF
jgi:tRNA threonylcarbamoyladenosine modification (KEOPS) complex  Pcc1 subunit